MTNETLRAVMRKYGYGERALARLTCRSVWTVRAWLKPATSRSARRIPRSAVRMLRQCLP